MTDILQIHTIESAAGWRSRFVSRIASWRDPNLLPFMFFLLLPALYYLVRILLGSSAPNATQFRADQLSFYWGLAIYAGVLKWIGWNVLTRWLPRDTRFPLSILFPAEILAGIAPCCAWFYLRNLLGYAWPASYSLFELGALKYAALAVHLIPFMSAESRGSGVSISRYVTDNLAVFGTYLIFVLCLYVTFRDVSMSLHAQSSDPLCHVYVARIYREHGIYNHGMPIVYTTGFGALNAVAASIAPLSMVQVVTLQHVLLVFLGFFLLTSAICFILQRHLWALNLMLLPYLLMIPLHNMRPWENYEGTARQAAPGLAAAICILPVLCSVSNRIGFWLMNFVVVSLEWLCVAFNPACAPFVVIFGFVVLAVFCFRSRRARQSVRNALLGHAALIVLGGALMIACDPYYSRILSPGKSRPNVSGQTMKMQRTEISVNEGVKRVAQTNPAVFGVTEEQVFDERPVLRWLPSCALALLCLTLLVSKLSKAPERPVRLLFGAGLCVGLWLSMVFSTAFIVGLLEPSSKIWDMSVLRYYLILLLFRFEVELVFFVIAACSSVLYVCVDSFSWRTKTLLFGPVLIFLLWFLPLGKMVHFRRVGFTMHDSARLGIVTHDDLRLVEWADRTIGADGGIVGLTATTFSVDSERHVYPMYGAQAMPLYAKQSKWCFFSVDPSGRFGFDDYVAHVVNGFDANWCIENGIRFFYAQNAGNFPAIDAAIKNGTLRPAQKFGDSVIYEIRKP